MLSNEDFLEIVRESFEAYLKVATLRTTAKLKVLHGSIAKDIKEILGKDFIIESQGYNKDRKVNIKGRYYSKRVDIFVKYKDCYVAGYALKFVMRNYNQNANNYFENMLGETANIRCNDILYFQIFIAFDEISYFDRDGNITKYQKFSGHNMEKYIKLSNDRTGICYHSPNKALIILLNLKDSSSDYNDKRIVISENNFSDYLEKYYRSKLTQNNNIEYSNIIKADDFGNSLILNNYEDFIKRTTYLIPASIKD